jgi:hypothetical protein
VTLVTCRWLRMALSFEGSGSSRYKDPMKTLTLFAALLMSLPAFAQAKPADAPATPPAAAPAAPQKTPIPVGADRDELLRATHKQDVVEKQMYDLNMRFMQFKDQATSQLNALQAEDKQDTEAVSAAKEKVCAALKLVHHCDVDTDAMEAANKPEPKPDAQAKATPATK